MPPAPALLGAVAAGALAVGPIPELGFALQGTGLGAPIGAAMAEWRRSRNPDYDGSRLGYFYRDEPWPWRPWRRDGSRPNGSPPA